MKATCQRDKLLHAFQMAASVAPSRSPKPILQNVKLEVTADGAMLMGTDLEVGVRVAVEGFDVAAPGTVVLPRDRFGKILSESSDEKLDLESDGGKVLVRGQRSEFHLPSQNPDEFPSVLRFEEQKYHEMPARFFREVIRRTVYATDNESSRYALGGVLIEFSATGLTAVATDGPATGPAGRARPVRRGSRFGRQHDHHSHARHAIARTGLGRQRGEHPSGRP